jgi:hypothetical protein
MRFSKRFGYQRVRESVQLESIDEPLRNALWNALQIHVWDNARHSTGMYSGYYLSSNSNSDLYVLCQRLWLHFFKQPLDQLDHNWTTVLKQLRQHFFGSEWFEVYDFVEFVAANYPRYQFRDPFLAACNAMLQREVSGYRLVDGIVSPITDKEQLAAIGQALERDAGPVQVHLRRALELLSDRSAPDYRNSIKESISAVEGLVAKTVADEKGTLGQLVKKLEQEIDLHPALSRSFNSLYGYTSDEGGIRHALMDAEVVSFTDAKFFLVVCSAFINFVDSKVDQRSLNQSPTDS